MLSFDILKDFVNIHSPSGNESDISNYIQKICEDNDIPFTIIPVNSSHNLYLGESKKAKIVLNTHMDVVAPFIPFSEKNDILYGRGISDAKGILWAMLNAFIELNSTEVGFLLTVEEESYSAGAKMMKNYPQYSSDYIICGEPTQGKIFSGQKGVLILEFSAKSKTGHSGINSPSANHILIKFLNAILELPLPLDDFFNETTVNVGTVQGGVASNVTSSACSARVFFRLSKPASHILNLITPLLNEYPEVSTKTLSQSDPIKYFDPFDKGEKLLAPFASDLAYLPQFGKPILLGPGTIEVAHTQHEHISKAELLDSIPLYVNLMKTLLKK